MLVFVKKNKKNTYLEFKVVIKVYTWVGAQKYPVEKKKDLNTKSFNE